MKDLPDSFEVEFEFPALHIKVQRSTNQSVGIDPDEISRNEIMKNVGTGKQIVQVTAQIIHRE
jgi:hypothetical protein